MRRYRFIGDPEAYFWLDFEGEYDVSFNDDGRQYSVGYLARKNPQDWVKLDPPKPMHKDTDLGYYAGLAMRAIIIAKETETDIKKLSRAAKITLSIAYANELIKQLDEQTKINDK